MNSTHPAHHAVSTLILHGAIASVIASLLAGVVVHHWFNLRFHKLPTEFFIAVCNGLVQGTLQPLMLAGGLGVGVGFSILQIGILYWIAHYADWNPLDGGKFAVVQLAILFVISFICLWLGIR